jgi:hypothetical protein
MNQSKAPHGSRVEQLTVVVVCVAAEEWLATHAEQCCDGWTEQPDAEREELPAEPIGEAGTALARSY